MKFSVRLISATLACAAVAGCASGASVKERISGIFKRGGIEVTVMNVTSAAYLAPILAVGHGEREESMFRLGEPASEQLQAVAEGGALDAMAATFVDRTVTLDPNEGLLGPGESVTFKIGGASTRLSLIAMILPTNDGFVALDGAAIDDAPFSLVAFDAGTEANDEAITGGGTPSTPGIPGDPSNMADKSATGVAGATIEGKVGVHPGIQGGDGSALDPSKHGWSGPVAKVTITR